MTVKINNLTLEVAEGTTLAALLEMQSVNTAGIATAVNGNVVPAASRGDHRLSEGDTVTVIRAFYGG